MNSIAGFGGAILFAIGGAILFGGLFDLFTRPDADQFGFVLLGLLGFFIIGLGLWLIALSGKPETKQTPS